MTSRAVLRRVVPVWVVLVISLFAFTGVIVGYLDHQNRERDGDLKAAQVAACLRLRSTIIDYNRQYGAILQALVAVQKTHPQEPVTREVIAAFRSPDFPLVRPPACDRIHLF